MASPMTKQQYDAAVMALGGKTKEREHPWEFAALKRRRALGLHGAAAQNTIASAKVLESFATANGMPQPPAAGAGGGGGGGR